MSGQRETPPSRTQTHFWAPGHVCKFKWPGPGPTASSLANHLECRILTPRQADRQWSNTCGRPPPVARARTGRRSVNTALVDSLAGHTHPSAAWCPLPPSPSLSPPTPFPHLAAPASLPRSPSLGAHNWLPRGPRPGCRPDTRGPTVPRAAPRRCPRTASGVSPPSPGAKSSQFLHAAPGAPCVLSRPAPCSQTHSPALGDWALKGGRPHFSRTYPRVRPCCPARSLAALWR